MELQPYTDNSNSTFASQAARLLTNLINSHSTYLAIEGVLSGFPNKHPVMLGIEQVLEYRNKQNYATDVRIALRGITDPNQLLADSLAQLNDVPHEASSGMVHSLITRNAQWKIDTMNHLYSIQQIYDDRIKGSISVHAAPSSTYPCEMLGITQSMNERATFSSWIIAPHQVGVPPYLCAAMTTTDLLGKQAQRTFDDFWFRSEPFSLTDSKMTETRALNQIAILSGTSKGGH